MTCGFEGSRPSPVSPVSKVLESAIAWGRAIGGRARPECSASVGRRRRLEGGFLSLS